MRIPVVIGLLLTLCISKAQSESTWKQIEQPYFRLIFNGDIGSEATRVADLLNHYFVAHLKEFPLNRPLRPIDIVLQTEAQISNGFVGLTPYRSVWFNRPGAFTGLDWFDALAVHESRHVVQFNQIYDTAIGRALGLAFGDTGSGLMAFFLLPSWFIEGDAVLSETMLTKGGRGRIAAFDLWFRADTVSNTEYSYDRAILGTDFERFPYLSPYVLGYYLTGYLQTRQGTDVFERSLSQIATAKGLNFNGRIHAETGQNLATHYQDLMEMLKVRWSQQNTELKTTPVSKLVNQPVGHWNSLYPVSVEGEKVIAVEVDAVEGYFLVEVHREEYQRLISLPKNIARNYYSESKTKSVFRANNQHCWVAEVSGRFKILKESGDLFCWSSSKGFVRKTKLNNLTSGVSSRNNFLVHQFNPDQSSLLQLLDSEGKWISEYQLPRNSLAFDLAPTDDGWLYVLTGTHSDGIYFIDRNLIESKLMKASQGQALRSPFKVSDRLIYASDQSGIDQIMGKSIKTGEEYQLATRPFGSYFPVWDSATESIVFSDYSANGQQLSRFYLNAEYNKPDMAIDSAEQSTKVLAFPSLLQEETPALPDQQNYQIKNYSKLGNLWHPHSWSINADGENITGYLSSTDPLESLNLDFMVNYQTESNIWDASVSGQYQTDMGPYFVLYAQETFDPFWGNPVEFSGQIIQPVFVQHGAMYYQWTPGLGTALKHQFGKTSDPFVYASLGLIASKDKPLQAIHRPLYFEQSFTGLIPTGNESRQLLSHTLLDIRGLSPRQNINLIIDAQEKAANDAPLLLTDSLFNTPDAAGLTVQTQLNYQMNLGPIGKPLSSVLFWRNTEVSANLKMQQNTNVTESAIGLSFQPNMNVLRNDRLIIEPMASVFYHVQNQTLSAKLSVTIAGN